MVLVRQDRGGQRIAILAGGHNGQVALALDTDEGVGRTFRSEGLPRLPPQQHRA
ncbi:hypothetical protein [Arthrobacter psychrolactophilus]